MFTFFIWYVFSKRKWINSSNGHMTCRENEVLFSGILLKMFCVEGELTKPLAFGIAGTEQEV